MRSSRPGGHCPDRIPFVRRTQPSRSMLPRCQFALSAPSPDRTRSSSNVPSSRVVAFRSFMPASTVAPAAGSPRSSTTLPEMRNTGTSSRMMSKPVRPPPGARDTGGASRSFHSPLGNSGRRRYGQETVLAWRQALKRVASRHIGSDLGNGAAAWIDRPDPHAFNRLPLGVEHHTTQPWPRHHRQIKRRRIIAGFDPDLPGGASNPYEGRTADHSSRSWCPYPADWDAPRDTSGCGDSARRVCGSMETWLTHSTWGISDSFPLVDFQQSVRQDSLCGSNH